MECKENEHKKQDDKENIRLNNQSIIPPTSDEEMSHAHNLRNASSSSDEWKSI